MFQHNIYLALTTWHFCHSPAFSRCRRAFRSKGDSQGSMGGGGSSTAQPPFRRQILDQAHATKRCRPVALEKNSTYLGFFAPGPRLRATGRFPKCIVPMKPAMCGNIRRQTRLRSCSAQPEILSGGFSTQGGKCCGGGLSQRSSP